MKNVRCKLQDPGFITSRRTPLSGVFERIRVQGLGFKVQGLGFRVQGLGFRVQGVGCRVQDLGFGVQGLGFAPARNQPEKKHIKVRRETKRFRGFSRETINFCGVPLCFFPAFPHFDNQLLGVPAGVKSDREQPARLLPFDRFDSSTLYSLCLTGYFRTAANHKPVF